jgi:SAM-dependent methyltransferase
VRSESELQDANRRFYGALWSEARLVQPQRFNTWPLVSALAQGAARRLEVAPGLRPRLPLTGTHFVDLSASALQRLQAGGAGSVAVGLISAIPFPDRSFDLVCALDIVEHVEDDDRALAELARVAMPGATLLLSVPLHPQSWTAFDDFVGHRRRYEPQLLLQKLQAHGLELQQSAVYGMQPQSSRLLDLGMWYLTHQRERAMWWYNKVMMPLSLRFQKKLALAPGLVPTAGVDEILMVCRKA